MKRNFFKAIILFSLLFFFSFCSSLQDEEILANDGGKMLRVKKSQTTGIWQSNLQDNLRVSEVLIPGTHDAGAYMHGGALVRTQNITLQEQLEVGVRAFDIRLRATSENTLEIYHGISGQGLYFEEDILVECMDFLANNPSEFLVFSLKKEGADFANSIGYGELLRQALAKPEYQGLFYPGFNKDLTVSDLRGKILVLHRSWITPPVGADFHNWRDNASFEGLIVTTPQQQNAKVFVEDCYKVPTLFHRNQKWNVTKENLELSTSNSNDWFITFSSGTSFLAYPISVANKVNPKLKVFLRAKADDYKGIVFVDFVNADLANAIYEANF